MTFSYYLFWTFLLNFPRKFWLAPELLWFCQRGTEKLKKKFFSNFFFFETTFFAKYFKYTLCWSGKYDIFPSEIIFSHWYLKINIRIGNFVVFFNQKVWNLLQLGFFIYFVKQLASIYLFFSFYNKEGHSLSFITAVFS